MQPRWVLMRISAQRSHGTVTSHHEVNKNSRPVFCSSHLLVCFVRPLIHVILLSIILFLAPSFRPPPARNPKVIPKWPGSLRLRRTSRSAPRRPPSTYCHFSAASLLLCAILLSFGSSKRVAQQERRPAPPHQRCPSLLSCPNVW